MKEINLPSGNYLFVEVPDDAYSFREKLIMDGAGLYVSFEPRIKHYLALQSVKISKNNKENYQIISTTKDITEEQAVSIVEQVLNNFWKNYDTIFDLSGFEGFNTAKESLQSLIQANGLDISKNYLILRKL